MLRRYGAGSDVLVYFHPTDHGLGILEPGATWRAYLALIIGAILLLVGGGLFATARKFV